MGPNPFNMPGFGSLSPHQNAQNLQQSVNQTAPLATQWHGLLQHEGPEQVFNQPSTPKANTGVLAGFTHFIGNIAGDVGHFVSGAGAAIGHALGGMASSVVKYPEGVYKGFEDKGQINQNMATSAHLSAESDNLFRQYKTGKISKQVYDQQTKELDKEFNSLINSENNLESKVKIDKQNTYKVTTDLASAIVTVVTLGGGDLVFVGGRALLGDSSIQAAAKYLTTEGAGAYLTAAEQTLRKVAADETAFKALTPAAQAATRDSVITAIQQAGNRAMASQIARGAVINLMIKYPLNYTALSQTGNEIYKQLDNKQYGAAIRTMAFSALLLTAGGPFAKAFKFGGSKAGLALFGEGSFWDKLSTYYGDGSPDGFANATRSIISKMTPQQAKEFIGQLSDAAATNIKATGGNVTMAVDRFANGMRYTYGHNLGLIDHEAALQDMAKMAKWHQVANDVAERLGMGKVAIGRWDARAKNIIANIVSLPTTKEERITAWEDWKTANSQLAGANNESIDAQMKRILSQDKTSEALKQDIKRIKTSFEVKGFPKDIARQMSSEGYIVIKPTKLEAPFEKGSGKFKTSFTEDNQDLFMKAKQPLPVLEHFGGALTSMGLSPYASSQAVYYTFNNNLAKNLVANNIGDIGKAKEESQLQAADTMVKKLTNYAHNPRLGFDIKGVQVRPPITDLRQLTTRDIQEALKINKIQAGIVKDSISDAMLQVPIAMRGLGDKVVDYARNLPLYNHYLSVQGAARFAWNPFFKIKLAAKTESLSQLESGGKILTVPGVNTMIRMIAPETYGEIQSTRRALTEAGIFDKGKVGVFGQAGFAGGEGFSDVGAESSALGHTLLPSQERSISSLVITQARKSGLSTEDFIKTYPNQVRDTVQAIVGYRKSSEFLNSPMARTINYAFFPFRFNVKVAGFMARALMRTDTITQFGVLHGLYNASNWLNSAEGQSWYSQNSQLIQLLKYFTPMETLSTVARVLGQQPHSVSDFGELGGLPFGWIPQVIDATFNTNITNTPYISPTTGDPLPKYVPITDRGHLLVAIQNMIGSLFTYPGATVGLPPKSNITKQAATFLTTGTTKTDKTDFNKVTPPIPPGLQSFSDAVKSVHQSQQSILLTNPEAQIQALPKNQQPAPNPGGPNPTNPVLQVPRLTSPIDTTPGKTPASAKPKKLKKSQFRPALLPGQSAYGEL